MKASTFLLGMTLAVAGDIALHAALLGTAISYQGRLNDGGSPANASYDFRFTLYDLPASGQMMHLIVRSLTITGGADLAEPFAMTEGQLPKGSVVVIDPAHPGKLKLSERTYDKRVAGVVSGANGINPGISLKQEGAMEGGQNVALTGRVYVQADASNGAIEPGDLLMTSDTPGHAMKVTDHTRAQGAILGKAMSALNDGEGLVLVLVTLQ